MKELNVLMVSHFDMHKGFLRDIAATDSRIEVRDGTAQFIADLRKTGKTSARLERLVKQGCPLAADQPLGESREDLDGLLARAEVVFGAVLPENLLARAPNMKWLQVSSAGLDHYLTPELVNCDRITITNARGALAVPLAEHCLMMMLMLARNAQRMLNNERNKKWERIESVELRDRVLGVVGLGAIGGEVARVAKGVGMKVIANRRSAAKRESDVLGIDELYPPSELLPMLHECDFVAITAPLTAETEGMIGKAELQAMKPTAYLVNIGRGKLIRQSVLIQALKEGWIAGAGLDVFEVEPLSADSELWGLPNAILSSHTGAFSDRRSHRLVALFCENLRRYLAGEPLLNVIDARRGY